MFVLSVSECLDREKMYIISYFTNLKSTSSNTLVERRVSWLNLIGLHIWFPFCARCEVPIVLEVKTYVALTRKASFVKVRRKDLRG